MNTDGFKQLLDESLKPIKEDLKEVKETLQNHSGALVRIESVLEGYADSYKINKHNIEDNLSIEVPEDLKVPHFAVK